MQKLNIYTEDKGDIPKIVSEFFDSFTVTKALGYYKGSPENSVIITLLLPEIDELKPRRKVYALAEKIRIENEQESVLVESISGVFANDLTTKGNVIL